MSAGTLMSRKELGDFGENYVSNYLKDLGFKVIGRNYHTKYGEIDIIATKDGKIHFVEVKTRKSLLFGTPEEAYSLKKQERIIKAALGYLKDNNINKSFQIDLVALILNDKNEVLSIAMYDNAINY
ncbi:MAG: YraN family protein [Caldisericia bacterium]|jgi:putative endonuclease|nr:YraN family protein [Caldisericia bacterium]